MKFPYNLCSDWLRQQALSENSNTEQVDDIKVAFKCLLRNFEKFYPNYKTSPVRL